MRDYLIIWWEVRSDNNWREQKVFASSLITSKQKEWRKLWGVKLSLIKLQTIVLKKKIVCCRFIFTRIEIEWIINGMKLNLPCYIVVGLLFASCVCCCEEHADNYSSFEGWNSIAPEKFDVRMLVVTWRAFTRLRWIKFRENFPSSSPFECECRKESIGERLGKIGCLIRRGKLECL